MPDHTAMITYKSTNRNFSSFELPQGFENPSCMVRWASAENTHMVFLSSSGMPSDDYSQIDAIMATGILQEICPSDGVDAFAELKNLSGKSQDWIFGFMSYDLKNQTEDLSSENHDGVKMPLMHFFIPEVVYIFTHGKVDIGVAEGVDKNHRQLFEDMINFKPKAFITGRMEINHRVGRDEYIHQVNHIKGHILRGDIYEMNYCIEFYGEAQIDPAETFLLLNRNNPAPFSCFYRFNNKYLLSSSPERFLAKRGQTLVSQPIKGTIRRGRTADEDLALKNQLYNDPKERSENVMIVDLVRNDLSRTARHGSVKVKELFGIYSYTYVHQMISTIESTLAEGIHFTQAIKECFPMGSMTGAPKVRAMQIIEASEATRRGLYSGAVGYISPWHDFDFNVIIRSILYNGDDHYVSFMAGSAITAASDAEKEYSECLLKAASMAKTLQADL
jgi:para-aminobenzoate synthetase component I